MILRNLEDMYSEITLAVLGKYSTTKVSQHFRMFSEIIQWIGLLRLQHVLGIHWSDSSNTLRMLPESLRHTKEIRKLFV